MKDLPHNELSVLLKQIALSDQKAIEKVFNHYRSSLFAFIRLRIRDEEAADEILNDTFLTAFRKPEQYNGSCEYKTWLCGIGACQGSCRFIYAAKGAISFCAICALITQSFSGLRVTGPITDQSRVFPDHLAG